MCLALECPSKRDRGDGRAVRKRKLIQRVTSHSLHIADGDLFIEAVATSSPSTNANRRVSLTIRSRRIRPLHFPLSNTSPSLCPTLDCASNEIVVDMVSVVRWMARVSSFCHQYGFSLRFSFSETLPWPSLPSFSLSFHLYFSFSPSLCLSILSSPDRPIRRPRPTTDRIAPRTWPTLPTQRTNTAKRVAVNKLHAVRAGLDCGGRRRGEVMLACRSLATDRHLFLGKH